MTHCNLTIALVPTRSIIELAQAMPNQDAPCSLDTLGQLPYLDAGIKRSVAYRLQHIYLDNILVFRDGVIAPGTPGVKGSSSSNINLQVFRHQMCLVLRTG